MERLLDFFRPTNYQIDLNINKHKGVAKGVVAISGEPGPAAASGKIKLHAKDLTIDRVRKDGEIVKFAHGGEILEIPSGKTFEITYHFDLNTNMEGAYLSSYNHNGAEELLVSTQFESHYARECFPCIDEPAAKATFDLSITVPDEDDIIIANTPVKSHENNTWTFEQTPKMSTYLLAFCIGRFHKKSKTSKNGVKVTTYCTLNHEPTSLNFANDIAVDSLDFYDQKFGIKYPLEKLDQVAIPDFEAGAMENWGLVTYRESCLLADKTTSKSQKEYIATVIAHELSHQWFGNLVTMKWWDNLWLNESFATMMEYVCVDHIRPSYRIFEDFFTGECRVALNRDAYPGVQAVQQDVNDPAEIATLFDGAIVYAKGAHLMFMLYRLMGESNFFKGIKDYFKAHKYSNTTSDDLWKALQLYADFDIKGFMDAWILQSGFPVITDGEQQRFLINGAKDDTKWPLPEVTDDMSGHYIINLSSDEFEKAIDDFENLSLEQKIRLLIDRSLLSKTSLVSSATLLDLIPKFRQEKNYPIWNPVAGLIADLRLFFTPDDPDYQDFQKYVDGVIAPQLARLGVDPKPREDDSDAKLRETMLGLAIFAENPEIIRTLAAKYSVKHTELDPETRYFILAAHMKVNEENAFSELLEAYQNTSDPEIKSDLLFVLSMAKNHEKELLKLLKSPKIVKPQDHLYLFARMLRNHKTSEKTADWLYENWEYVETLTGDKSLEDYPRILAAIIRTPEEATKFEDFFSEKADNPVLRRALKVAKTEITARLRLLNLDNESVHSHLAEIFSKNL
ncbi:M1 family metallopeptidase [Candidatus Saccharibacteria bacterium]|nr:M1 family metallopeptidase [Candidatus Saccharibacteria bacterium]